MLSNKKLGEIADVTKLSGFEFTKYITYLDEGEIIALRGVNIKNGLLDLTNIKKISKEISEILPRSKLKKNDIVLSYTGTLGEVAIIEENEKYHLAPNVCVVRPKINPYYLYSYMKSDNFKNYIKKFSVGSTQKTIPMKNIREIPITLPQDKQINFFSDLFELIDKKIFFYEKKIRYLSDISNNIFNNWFLEKKLKKDKLSKLIFEKKDKVKNEDCTVLTALKIGELTKSENYFSKKVHSKNISKYIKVSPFDFAFNPSRINIGSIGMNKNNFIGAVSPVYKVFEVKKNYHWYVEKILSMNSTKNKIKIMSSGSVRQSLSFKDLSDIMVSIPDLEILVKFNKMHELILDQILHLRKKINILNKINRNSFEISIQR